ncbi:hypothetical protein [Spiroplasma ixodetis]|uniref:Uncharacterized protein n=1 Tax=Spiroplasma ixodetis TaxID=2141 RepID=A0ABM8BXA9_9MOLU|nr:hypothetical protein [Spiroplasma ixodetis]BDT04513.1 hypothetical protein SHM_21590 [Spiroplasma ixodetis]
MTIIINNSLFYDKNIKNILENIFYQEYEEYITNKAKVEIIKAFLPLCTILILSHKCWEKPIYGLLPTFLNQT